MAVVQATRFVLRATSPAALEEAVAARWLVGFFGSGNGRQYFRLIEQHRLIGMGGGVLLLGYPA